MSVFIATFILSWVAFVMLPMTIGGTGARRWLSIALPMTYLLGMFALGSSLLPWQRLLISTAGMLYALKSALLFKLDLPELRQYSRSGIFLFMSVWPGFDLVSFKVRGASAANLEGTESATNLEGTESATNLEGTESATSAMGTESATSAMGTTSATNATGTTSATSDDNDAAKLFVRGYKRFLAGILLAPLLAFAAPFLDERIVGFAGIALFLMIIHFGYSSMLTGGLRLAGFPVHPLFVEPFASASLNDFWSHRWNLAFVEMDKLIFLPLLRKTLSRKQAVIAIFVLSGLLHELAISYPSAGGWGGPLLYFVIQPIGITLERKLKLKGAIGRVWTYLWLFLPIPILFHPTFRAAFMLPPLIILHDFLSNLPPDFLLSLAIWCAGIGHFCTLGAGLQVPFRLNWKEELAKISTFNRKIFLNYAAYVGITIISMGTITLVLHDEMLRGEKAAMCIAAFISLFWVLRLVVDRFYFKDDDWPKGPMMIIGHALLNTLFICLAATYLAVLMKNYAVFLPFFSTHSSHLPTNRV